MRMGRAEQTQLSTNRKIVIEDLLLFVGLLGNDKDRLAVDGRERAGIVRLYRGRKPVFMLTE